MFHSGNGEEGSTAIENVHVATLSTMDQLDLEVELRCEVERALKENSVMNPYLTVWVPQPMKGYIGNLACRVTRQHIKIHGKADGS